MMRLTVPVSNRLPLHSRRLIIWLSDQAICFFNHEHDSVLRAFGDLDLIAGFADQIGDIDNRQRIGAVNFQEIARRKRFQGFACLQCRQRTFETGEIELGGCHVPNMAKGCRIVNAHRVNDQLHIRLA